MAKKQEKTVVFYWDDRHEGYWSVKDENGMMRGYSREHNSFEESLKKAWEYTFGYYKNLWYGHPIKFVIDESVYGKDTGR